MTYAELVEQTIAKYQSQDARTVQSKKRKLGPSELGGCREYIRATIAGDPRDTQPERMMLAAFIGTSVGDKIEEAFKKVHPGSQTQVPVTYTLPTLGLKISGHADIVSPADKVVIDMKTTTDFATVQREGSLFKYYVQISIYLLGLIEMTLLPEDSKGVLVYVDRSATQKRFIEDVITVEQAQEYVAIAEERLKGVQLDLASGRRSPRDEPEQFCFYIACPFYSKCWEGYQPDKRITSERFLKAMERYDNAREQEKLVRAEKEAAKQELQFPSGITGDPVEGQSDDYILKWSYRTNANNGEIYPTIDLRRK